MKDKAIVVFFLIAMSVNLACYGQNVADTSRTFRIETKDGNVFSGSVVTLDSTSLVLKTATYGEIRIPLDEIKSKTELKQVVIVNNKIWLPNPQSARYFWAPNGYGLEEGRSYYQNIWVLYNQFSYGFTNNFSVGAGFIPLFLFGGAPTPAWLVPKISIPVIHDKLNLGTGAFLGKIMGEEGSGTFGLLYETSTIGSRDKNLSLGLAYGFAAGNWMKLPIINVSATIRTGPKGYFMTENYVIPYETEKQIDTGYPFTYETKNTSAVVLSFGGRSIIRNVGLDYCLVIPANAGIGNFVAVPFLGATIPLTKK